MSDSDSSSQESQVDANQPVSTLGGNLLTPPRTNPRTGLSNPNITQTPTSRGNIQLQPQNLNMTGPQVSTYLVKSMPSIQPFSGEPGSLSISDFVRILEQSYVTNHVTDDLAKISEAKCHLKPNSNAFGVVNHWNEFQTCTTWNEFKGQLFKVFKTPGQLSAIIVFRELKNCKWNPNEGHLAFISRVENLGRNLREANAAASYKNYAALDDSALKFIVMSTVFSQFNPIAQSRIEKNYDSQMPLYENFKKAAGGEKDLNVININLTRNISARNNDAKILQAKLNNRDKKYEIKIKQNPTPVRKEKVTFKKVYHTYKFHSFPTFHENIHSYRVLLSFRLPYMLLSSDLKSITHLDNDDFRLCNHVFIPVSTYLCFLSHTLYDFPLSNSNELAPQRCQETIIRMSSAKGCQFSPYTSNETLVKRVKERIYLSSTNPLQAVVNCPSGNTRPLLQELTILSPGCSFSSRGVSLLNYREVRGDLLIPTPTREIPVIHALDFSGKFPIEAANFTPVIAYSNHDALIQGKIQESNDLLKKAKEVSTHSTFITAGVSLTTVLVLSGILAFLCCRPRLREPRYAKCKASYSRQSFSETASIPKEDTAATLARRPDEHEKVRFEMNPVTFLQTFGPLEPKEETSGNPHYSYPRFGNPRPVCENQVALQQTDDYIDMGASNSRASVPSPAERLIFEPPLCKK